MQNVLRKVSCLKYIQSIEMCEIWKEFSDNYGLKIPFIKLKLPLVKYIHRFY